MEVEGLDSNRNPLNIMDSVEVNSLPAHKVLINKRAPMENNQRYA